jgi:glycosyltransferase involved in cell wall biosynthesis
VRVSRVEPVARNDLEQWPGPRLRSAYAELGKRLNVAEIAHVQHENAYFVDFRRRLQVFEDLARQVEVPLVLTLHEVPERPVGRSRDLGPLPALLRDVRNRLVYRGLLEYINAGMADAADLVLVHTRAARDLLANRGVDAARIHVLAHPVPDAVPDTGEDLRERLGLRDKVVLLTFGQLNERKGHVRVVEALAALPPRYVYLVAGDVDAEPSRAHRQRLEERARALGVSDRLIFWGPIAEANVPALMRSCDLYVAPATWMTASGSLMQAIAYERPALAADLPAVREMNADVACVSTFETSPPGGLARRISELCEDERARRLLAEGCRVYRERHSQAAYVKSLLELYRGLVKGDASARRAAPRQSGSRAS